MATLLSEMTESDKKKYFGMMLTVRDGNITKTCREVGIGIKKYRNWLEEDPEFAADCDAARMALVDLGQDALVKNVRDGKSTDIQFLLKTQGKDRGYGEKVEIDHTGTVQHQHGLQWAPPQPKTIQEWEAQVAQAEKLRLGQAKELESPKKAGIVEVAVHELNTGPVRRELALVAVNL